MGLESSFDNVSDLVETNPAAGDARSVGDDHLRGIKNVLVRTLERMPGAGEPLAELTISSGAITPTIGMQTVDTESDAASDDLDTITATNFLSGSLLMIRNANSARSVVLKHNTGNIQLPDNADMTLSDATAFLLLRYDGSNWYVILWRIVSIESLSVDTISENTADAGVTVDGVLLKDSEVTTDVVNEKTSATGVTIDGMLIKDSAPSTDQINEKTSGVGTGIDSVVGATKAGTGEILRTKTIEIGDWNMDSTTSVAVTHGLTLAKIRQISVYIRNDAANSTYPLNVGTSATDAAPNGFTAGAGATTSVLFRLTGGFFDSTSFNSTSFNRGWITYLYAD